MTRSELILLRSRRRSERARARLYGSLGMLQARLRPSALAGEATTRLREAVDDFADDAISLVKERPGYVAGIIIAIIVYLLRGSIWQRIVAMFSKDEATDPGSDVFDEESRRAARHAGVEDES